MSSLLRLRVLITPSTQRIFFHRVAYTQLSSPLLARHFHFTGIRHNEPTKSDPAQTASSKADVPATSVTRTTSTPAPAKPAPKKSLWEKVKHEANHYWDGTKLLGLEIKISFKLALKTAAGYELNRRESNQLERTIQDIVRLVPFSMFVIVPFAELLLPVALKLFPNLLPSTYESSSEKEKKTKSLRDTRKKVSTMLRETVKMKLPSTVTEEQKLDFRDFVQRLKNGMEPPTKEQTMRVARLFKDDTVLDNLERPQLVAMSRYLNLQPIGTNEMLRFRIRYKLLNIKNDDKAIDYEGVDSLTTMEAQAACAARGIRIANVNSIKLRHDLEMWLQMTLKERIPPTLLVLSNAYTYGDLNEPESIYDALQAVLSSMPEQVHHIVESDVDSELTNKQRLELIKEQEELIQNETKQDTGVKIPIKDKIKLDEVDEPVVEGMTEEHMRDDAVEDGVGETVTEKKPVENPVEEKVAEENTEATEKK